MSSTQRSSTNLVTLKEILEHGFVAGASSCINFSPGISYYLETDSTSKPDAWDGILDLENTTKGSSQLVLKWPESLSSCVKGDLNCVTQGLCDGGLAYFCKTPSVPVTFDLSSVVSESNSRANSIIDVFCDAKSSTPCKEEKHPKSMENLLSKSSEITTEFSSLRKPPPPIWEISEIQAPLDNTLSLDASVEELRSLGSLKPDTPSLEKSVFAIALAWPGAATKRSYAPAFRSLSYDTQGSEPEPLTTAHCMKPFDFAIPSLTDGLTSQMGHKNQNCSNERGKE
ncbi:uncharacterized protein LOC123348574 [Mauremys mutica]|uniref:uncharacterized protein LOC123348574 n=1 Tax=Mauremys mutica TaxID=74926 RepID=UPI001D15F64B|nr:uncharacterized protein LOC123348574 [Mauremys mutica]XP_044842039.1 uncharacterized protein LOC123348574 [Mauremys mutica]XP_044842040.1 uncharacterized protein LOC123348574 [Mauremys mutica]XP_044842041.1 uncharacterized protein LOC123348574 [Mauremys mutica]